MSQNRQVYQQELDTTNQKPNIQIEINLMMW